MRDRDLSASRVFAKRMQGDEDEKWTGTLVIHYQLLIYSSMPEFEHRVRIKALRERGLSASRVLGMMVGVGKGVALNLLITRLLYTFLWV